jgi:hypothetical protein
MVSQDRCDGGRERHANQEFSRFQDLYNGAVRAERQAAIQNIPHDVGNYKKDTNIRYPETGRTGEAPCDQPDRGIRHRAEGVEMLGGVHRRWHQDTGDDQRRQTKHAAIQAIQDQSENGQAAACELVHGLRLFRRGFAVAGIVDRFGVRRGDRGRHRVGMRFLRRRIAVTGVVRLGFDLLVHGTTFRLVEKRLDCTLLD